MWSTLVDSLVYFPDRELYGDPADVGLAFTDLTIPTEDGERLHAWWIPTRVMPVRGHVLFFHGNAGNVSHRLEHAVALTAAGLDLLLLDYRGYGRSTGRPNEEGLHRDAHAARAALVAGGHVDPARLVYMGESLGGAVALRLALEAPPLACVLQSSFTSLRDVARQHYPAALSALAGDAYPNLERIARLQAPVLILHGEVDEIVPLAHAEALFEAAREPRRLHVVPGAGHNDLVQAMGPSYGTEVAAWLG
ncbi:MAG: alpha/beta hydrolase [Acidobacteria bacterium]|nr:MAG: alpha/beta hydrolase [Acidobacteriota bacterium]